MKIPEVRGAPPVRNPTPFPQLAKASNLPELPAGRAELPLGQRASPRLAIRSQENEHGLPKPDRCFRFGGDAELVDHRRTGVRRDQVSELERPVGATWRKSGFTLGSDQAAGCRAAGPVDPRVPSDLRGECQKSSRRRARSGPNRAL